MPTSNPSPLGAIGLFSGGLDSQLAVCMVREQGVEVLGLVFESPFFSSARARAAAEQLHLPLRVEDFTADILELIAHPRHGFGSGMNPCIDCHARMIRRAGFLMEREGYHFLFTGEILNQRPMSQNPRSLALVAEESGFSNRLVRPLSARLLPESEVERRGWLDRARLGDFEGRSRKRHMEFASHYGIREIPPVAGGCCLAEPNFAARLRDLRKHEGVENLSLVRLLFHGRHFRLSPRVKCIVGRNESDNRILREQFFSAGWLGLEALDRKGPFCLLPEGADEDCRQRAASLCAHYAKARHGIPIPIQIRTYSGPAVVLLSPPADALLLEQWRIA